MGSAVDKQKLSEPDAEEVESVFGQLIATLSARKQTVSAAESLTAGLFCATMASIPGASAVLRGGAVTYATECKHLLADVPEDVLANYGPVSRLTAQHMAFGIGKKIRSDWAVALTGVAGPEGQDGHPVGEVWCAISAPGDNSALDSRVHRLEITPSLGRNAIRQRAVVLAAGLLLDYL